MGVGSPALSSRLNGWLFAQGSRWPEKSVKGSKEKQKDNRMSSIHLLYRGFICSTVLTFFLYLGTRRNPSAFKYSSTNLAALSTASTIFLEPQESAAISALMSTIRLGLLRSDSSIDTYVPCNSSSTFPSMIKSMIQQFSIAYMRVPCGVLTGETLWLR